jgi:diguanylate cyclase (GGDEF)-like protein
MEIKPESMRQNNAEKVLIVEDTRSISLLLSERIESELHFETNAAFTFEEAKSILEVNADFFVAILDLNLPDAPNGEIVDFVLSKQIPCIILTATLDDEVRERIISRNAVDYVVKQNIWSIEYVIRIIQRVYLNQSIRVLVVDDSPSYRTHSRNLLEAQRYNVLEARNGEEALQVLKLYPDVKLIITDYNMPKMDGVELASQVRRRFTKEQIAIIGLSSEASSVLSARFLKSGANDFLRKPFVSEEFYARVTQNMEMIELIEKLREAAIKDPLTRLFNRGYCMEAGGRLLDRSRKAGSPFAVGLVDIDYFKKVNDTYGHDAGDMALRNLADILQERVVEPHIVGRFGGEEFCILASGMDNGDIIPFFESIRETVEQAEVSYKGQSIRFTISTGVSTGPMPSLEGMINRADELLYQAKREGRNRVILEESA